MQRALFQSQVRRILCRSPYARCTASGLRDVAVFEAAQFPARLTSFPRRCLRSCHPRMGMLDSLRSTYDGVRENAEVKRERRMFEVQMRFLSDPNRPLDANCFLDIISSMKEAAGVGGFKENLPWVQNNPLLSELKDQQAIIHAMAPAERTNQSNLPISSKKRIARTAGQTIDAVESLLTQIDTMRSVQKWLLRRKTAGQAMPRNSKELQAMVSAPGSGMPKKAPARASSMRGPRAGVRH